MLATFWVLIVMAGLCYILDYRRDMWCDHIIIPSCLIISVASYTKIFCILSHHHEAHLQGLYKFIQRFNIWDQSFARKQPSKQIMTEETHDKK